MLLSCIAVVLVACFVASVVCMLYTLFWDNDAGGNTDGALGVFILCATACVGSGLPLAGLITGWLLGYPFVGLGASIGTLIAGAVHAYWAISQQSRAVP